MITVAPGDSLWKIAERELGDGSRWKEIAKANGIKDPRRLQPGQNLTIPGKEDTAPIPRMRDDQPDLAPKSRPMAANNPMGIRANINTHVLESEGEVGDAKYLRFPTPEQGVAAYSTYLMQLKRVGLETTDEWVRETMEHFNPITRTRIKEIADQALGIEGEELIDLMDPAVQLKLATVAMVANNKSVPVRPAAVKKIIQQTLTPVEPPKPDAQVRRYLENKLIDLRDASDQRVTEQRAQTQGNLIEDLNAVQNQTESERINAEQAHQFSNQWRYGPGEE